MLRKAKARSCAPADVGGQNRRGQTRAESTRPSSQKKTRSREIALTENRWPGSARRGIQESGPATSSREYESGQSKAFQFRRSDAEPAWLRGRDPLSSKRSPRQSHAGFA